MATMRVQQLINDRGNGAMNQFVITWGFNTVFQSYDSMIADVDELTNTITFGKNWNYSRTTGKHRNIFFRDYVGLPELSTTDGIRKALKDGEVKVGSVVWKIRTEG